jgi:glycosyltransferase involved in cell wall biosynthesis
MPRILFIAYAYPPLPAAGSIRAAGLAKYLPRFGWDVQVLTARLPKGARLAAHVVETECRDVVGEWKSRFGMDSGQSVHEALNLSLPEKPNSNRLHTTLIQYARGLIAFPDEQKGWINFAVNALSKMNGKETPDIILSTSPPASGHVIASRARQLFNRPWVADLRDLWAENMWGVPGLLHPLHNRLEKKTFKIADALVTVSAPWAQSLQKKYPAKPVYTITNGFDPDDFRVQLESLTKYFSLTHTGRLYEGKRDPSLLFEVVRDLVVEGILQKHDIRVRFYGPPEPWLAALVERYGLGEIVEQGGMLSRDEALRRQAQSQLLVLLGWSDPKETGQHTGKLFEYFGSARPILAVGGSAGVLTETLKETGTGVHISDKNLLRQYLVSAYAEFKSNGFVSYHGDQAAIGRYTHMEMARRFSEVFQRLLPPDGGRLQSHTL